MAFLYVENRRHRHHPLAASNGHRYVLVAIDYFTKWAEATSYKTATAATTEKFIWNNIMARYGVPHAMTMGRIS